MLGQLNIFDKKDKLHKTLDRICEFEPKEGYYLAFSGGKDSQCIYHLCKMAGVKFDAHFNLTTVDPPELVYFIRKNYPNVEERHPEKSMWQLIIENSGPPTQLMRYCCKELKETNSGSDRICVTGVRWQESTKRAKRKMVEACMKDKTKHYFNAIVDWDVGEVWDFLNGNRVNHCGLYDEGWKRIGCIGCPMGNKKGMLRDFARWPKYKLNYLRTFDRLLKEKPKKLNTWKTAEEVFYWWVYRPPKGDPDQTIMIE
jgi:phosphoadenosine phosphosulfate reductase